MHELYWIIAAFFLPLFPFGMLFNGLFQRAGGLWQRVGLLLVWPLPGVWLLQQSAAGLPGWVVYWAVLTAALYAFRAVVVKEINIWTGFLATSAWALNWIEPGLGVSMNQLPLHVMAFTLPLIIMAMLAASVEKQYESVHTGVISGLAQVQPKLAGLFFIAMLAVIASPLFPSFFSMLEKIQQSILVVPAAALILVIVWLLWSWSGIRLLQGLLIGPVVQKAHSDISQAVTVAYLMTFVILIVAGLYLSGVML